ncbi:hypothetical protein [Gimesia maris]|jgi:uncharacterized protein with WD repeat|uniref:Uncharacterized protein n=1 Tax=Gimesia maris TaxID=122 RepID=A0A3D3R4B8_9PLAN|nr:hypothetical protein [Gimesia maris]MAC56615.1 hypothetical protein [Gimesia sp.]HAW32758.1 hypothetical protein [Planctomycetaceae bacterium]EDL59269.1 hypothetical protein PM8797T_23519 [Gimesia maris DSM 8797]QDT80522.1 hypothetical protein Mal35_39930 [Gimesia maris]QDU16167.1 hypothetical protein CA11_39950 [Gimesia maris]|tara:strand:- start:147 stop:395 length:249 start_codon:yes stop_codon:yes gene_type:complete
MSLRRSQLERQLQNAETAIADYSKVLDEQNLTPQQRKKHPKWKQVNAQRLQILNRLKSLKVIEDREEAIKQGLAASTESSED